MQIDDAVYPQRQSSADGLGRRITTKRLRAVGQARLAAGLGLSQPRVSRLFKKSVNRQYIREARKRDAVSLLLQKARK